MSRANLELSLPARPPLPQVCAHQGPADHVGRTWCLALPELPFFLFVLFAVCLAVSLCLATAPGPSRLFCIKALLALLDHLFCSKALLALMDHLSTSRHHSPHFTICSVTCVPPTPVLWTASCCSLIPGDTIPVIMVVLFIFFCFNCIYCSSMPPHLWTALLLQPLCTSSYQLIPAHTSFIPATYQAHATLLHLCHVSP